MEEFRCITIKIILIEIIIILLLKWLGTTFNICILSSKMYKLWIKYVLNVGTTHSSRELQGHEYILNKTLRNNLLLIMQDWNSQLTLFCITILLFSQNVLCTVVLYTYTFPDRIGTVVDSVNTATRIINF